MNAARPDDVIRLAQRLTVPGSTRALLFDMDGVLIDSLAQDYALVGPLLAPYRGGDYTVPRELVRRWFALSIDDFWAKLVAELGVTLPAGALEDLVERHEQSRRDTAPTVHEGIVDLLTAAREADLRVAVVSNNPGREVRRMLAACRLLDFFDAVVGNDLPGLARKPAPDPYLAAARELGVAPESCVAIEDSVLGLESAHRAGCYVVGVATGASTLEALSDSGYANQCYVDFHTGGNVRETALRVRKGVLAAAPYVLDWSGLDRRNLIRLDRNEATRPLSTLVSDALTRHIAEHGVQAYPDVAELAAAIAAYCGVTDSSVLPTNGSDQAIDLCLRAFLNPGDTLLVARPEFPIFGHTAQLLEANVHGVPFGPDLEFPYDAFRSALATRPDLIVFINPNNPTGTPVDLAFIEEVAGRWPDVPVVVDEAYFEFTGITAVPLIASHPNVIVLRTFSKAFAMAGLRLGYVVADPPVIAQLTKLRNPFDVNALAAVAAQAQLGALGEVQAYVHEVTTVVKPMTVEFFQRRQIPIWPGAANFVLVRPDDCDAVIAALRTAGILVRRIGALTGTFRMSLGTRAEMATVLDVYAGVFR